MRRLLGAVLVVAGLAGCRERLTVPGQCPDQCPGGLMTIRDTTIEAIEGADSAFVGYVGFHDAPGLLLTNDSAVGIAHAVVAFDSLPSTIVVGGVEYQYTLDSVIVSLGITSRDTLVRSPKLLLYQLAPGVDSTLTFAELDGLFQAGTPVDTLVVPDSVVQGELNKTYKDDELAKLTIPEEHDGFLTLGIRLEADTATGVRLGSRLTEGFSPAVAFFVTINVTDDSTEVQFATPAPLYTGTVRNTTPLLDPDLLTVGGLPAARSIIRFALPPAVAQGGSLLRATLELTPARPFYGLLRDPTLMDVRAVVVDLGFKSVPISTSAASAALPISGEGVFTVEVGGIVNIWRLEPLVPRIFYLSIDPEGQAFGEPVFLSTRSPTGRPRLRLTYTVPARLEVP